MPKRKLLKKNRDSRFLLYALVIALLSGLAYLLLNFEDIVGQATEAVGAPACEQGKFYLASDGTLELCNCVGSSCARGSCEGSECKRTKQIIINPSGGSVSVDGGAPITDGSPPEQKQLPLGVGERHTLSVVDVPASPAQGTQFLFDRWEPALQNSQIVVTHDATYAPRWKKQHQLTVAANPAEGGAATLETGWHDEGSSVTVHASPTANYAFDGWTISPAGECSGTGSCTLTMSGPKTVTALFRPVVSQPSQSPFDLTNVEIANIAPRNYGGDWFRFVMVFKDKHVERGYRDDTATLLSKTMAEIILTKDGLPFKSATKKGPFVGGEEGTYFFQDSYQLASFLSTNGAGEYCIDKALLYYNNFKVNEVAFKTKECVKAAQVSDTSYRYENKRAGVCLIYTPDTSDYHNDVASSCPGMAPLTVLDSVTKAATTYQTYFYSPDVKKYSRFYWNLELIIPDLSMIKLLYTREGGAVEKDIPFTTTKSDGKTIPSLSFHENFHGRAPDMTQSLLDRAGKYCLERIFINTKSPDPKCFEWNLKKCVTLEETVEPVQFQARFFISALGDESAPVSVQCTPLELQPCMDSDSASGATPQEQMFVKGSISYIEDTSTSRSKKFGEDICIIPSLHRGAPDNKCGGTDCGVREQFCDIQAALGHGSKEIKCAWGCANGACLPEQIQDADVYFTSGALYSAYTYKLVSGQPSTVEQVSEPIPARTGDIISFSSPANPTAKNKGLGRGQFTYKFKVYYEGKLVNDNGQAVDYASGDSGDNYFALNPFLTTPFRIPTGDSEILYPETDASVADSKKQHTLLWSGVYKKPGKYKLEFIAVSKPLDGVDRETNNFNNVLTKEINVVAARPPFFSYIASVKKQDGTSEYLTINNKLLDGGEGKDCNHFELARDSQDRLTSSNVCSITFTPRTLGYTAQDSYEFFVRSYISEKSLNAKEITLKITSPGLAAPIEQACRSAGEENFVCAIPVTAEPLTLNPDQEYTVEFRTK